MCVCKQEEEEEEEEAEEEEEDDDKASIHSQKALPRCESRRRHTHTHNPRKQLVFS
jgi:hypothetical protein